jgi:hypothetical protein
MKTQLQIALLSAACATLWMPVAAQTQTTSQTINQRKDNQQDRIANGVQSGEFTAGETRSLERKEANLNKEEKLMRREDGGKLSGADKKALNQQQNQLARDIYKDKHNGAVQNTDPKSEVGQRQRNQQERIAQGIKSGQMSAGEAARAEHNETAINHEIRNDRAANGGHLTAAEKQQVNRQENRESKQIYREKHNARHQ